LRCLVALAAIGCAGHAPVRGVLERGAPAPDVTAVDLAGRPVRLAALRGRRVVLDFWETTCAPCQRALPALADLAARHARLAIVSITPEHASDELRGFIAAHGMTWIVATDEADVVGAAFRVTGYPTYYLIEEAGTIACAACTLEQIEHALGSS
jgi:peroxiredoxin